MSRQPSHLNEADQERGAILYLRAKQSEEAADVRALEHWIGRDERKRRLIRGLGRVWDGVGQLGDDRRVVGWRTRRAAAGGRFSWSRSGVQMPLAAGIVLVVGAALLLFGSPRQAEQPFTTAVGERRELTLPDGSKLFLDAASRVTVSYSPWERIVRLVDGQARFQVAHDALRPFHVEVADNDVRAVGTDFNVSAAQGKVSVSLIKGSVLVSQIEERPALFGLRRVTVKNPVVTLKPGQRFERSGKGERLLRFDPRIVSAWQDGRLVFEDLPLSEAIVLTNRYSRRPIVLDRQFAPIKVTGVFHAGDGLPFAQAATAYLPGAELEVSSSRIVISKREEVSSVEE